MLLSIIPMAVAADGTIVKDGVTLYTTKKPVDYKFLRNNNANAVTKNVGETGSYQRLPRDTRIHNYCGRTATEFIPDYYAASTTTVELGNPEILTDVSYTISGWNGNDVYNGDPCLTFNYTAAKEGTTTVKLTFYYNYNCNGGYTYCQGCGSQVYIKPNTTWYQETTTFTVTVGDGEVPTPNKPDKPTVDDVERFCNYVNSTSSSKGAVYMWCDTYDHHAWYSYITDVDDTYTLGDVVANDGSVLSKTTYPWICVMTLDANKYLDAYNSELGNEYGTHYLADGEPETQTVIWYYNSAKSAWQYIKSEAPVYIDITHTAPTPAVKEFTVTYTDGVDGTAFADQTYTVKENDPTPAFKGTPAREGYVFLGWEPEVAETVTANATYTAKWEEALTSVTLKTSANEGTLMFLHDTLTVTATANTAADITLDVKSYKDGSEINNLKLVDTKVSEDGKTTVFTYEVVNVRNGFAHAGFTATATKGNQPPVTSELLKRGINFRNRIHVTIKNTAGEIISNVTNIKLNHKYPQWNKCPELKFDVTKQEYVMKNAWDLQNQEFVSVSFDYEGDTYETKVTKDGKNLFDVVRAGEEEIYVEYTVVDPIYLTIEVNGEKVVDREKFKGQANQAMDYKTRYMAILTELIAENKAPIDITTYVDNEVNATAVFGVNKEVKIVIRTV